MVLDSIDPPKLAAQACPAIAENCYNPKSFLYVWGIKDMVSAYFIRRKDNNASEV